MQWKYIIVLIMVFFLLPPFLTRVISGKNSIEVEKNMGYEKVLPLILCETIPWEYEEEVLKAQAVLERSNLYYWEEKNEKLWNQKMDDYYKLSQKINFDKAYERMEEAVYKTQGEILRFDGKVCRGVYHKASAGKTRSEGDLFVSMDLKYLQSVESTADLEYEEEVQGFYFTIEAWKQRMKENYEDILFEKEAIEDEICVTDRDTSGYVISLKVGNKIISGEEFRKIMGLTSSNFEIQCLDKSIRFLCNGVGHGFGLSQYGGNELAKKGSTYKEILKFYFPGTEIY